MRDAAIYLLRCTISAAMLHPADAKSWSCFLSYYSAYAPTPVPEASCAANGCSKRDTLARAALEDEG